MKHERLLIFMLVIFLSGCTHENLITNSIEKNSETSTKSQLEHIEETSYLGEWEIKSLLFYGKVGVYSDDDINKMIGKKLTFSEGKATCFGDSIEYLDETVNKPKYIETKVTKEEFVSEYKLPLDVIKFLSNDFIDVKVKDANDIKCHFIIIDKNSLLLIGGGAFLLLRHV